ncbi:MAG: class I SAM-dependent methyltransferase [Rhodospirillaceae bacterium]|jgi:ubiquinone/menaquinone biosynthesis C-methylase UbiE|nr:class I SAM-dependent methyltransferase [Rhodospirillaceae bacterium]MBT5242918.1 class I SAM-dependent methyltransferase [Rhodospirillaceae bacterium]MBT5563142.1 class I SAM-dependent methyltransferase [Rhodospirillaceae bacterium]MBT6243457.1 class I SAM-dependent methyltransferase [Rhodospirillaceae bacterium]MBT7138303.1 class I SAM-dependent methyltransferase [Rhodospirillaceae bacterium]
MSSVPSTSSKDFWEKQGREHGASKLAVNFDPIGEELPFKMLEEEVADGLAVCDLGCGNGRTLLRLAEARSNGYFVGFDFAESMIETAEQRRLEMGLNNVSFHVFDASKDTMVADYIGAQDIVLTKRLLVNVRGAAKKNAVQLVHSLLKYGGKYIMMECFSGPLARINEIREKLDLEAIQVNSFNEYLEDDFLEFLSPLFEIEKKIDYESLYYFISRIFNAVLSDGEPAYDAPINKLAENLMKMGVNPIEGYSPEVGYILKKR